MKLNKVVKTLIFYDLVLWFGWGLVTPILAIFIVDNIQGGDAKVAGIAVGIYWILKSLLQIPISKYLDATGGETDDYYFLVGGVLVASFVPFGFIFSTQPWHLYILQAVHALAMAAAIPAWCGIFTRHIKKGNEAQSWAWDSSALGVGLGTAGIIGGTVAKFFGFTILFIAVGIFGMISVAACLFIKNDLSPKEEVILTHKP